MMFKNSLKLLVANFSTVWKLMLYYIITAAIIVGLIAPYFSLIGQQLNSTGILTQIGELATTFNVSVNISSFLTQLYALLVSFFDLILSLFVTHTFPAIYLTIVLLYITPLLFGLADLPVGHTLFGYMSSLTKYSFTGSYIKMFGRSVRFQFFKNLIYLPINIAIIPLLALALSLTSVGGLMIYFLPIIIVAILAIVIALKRTLFAGWMPAIVVYDCNMFVGLKRGVTAVMRRFFKTLSTALMMMLAVIAINYLFGTFAFLIIIPFTMMFFYVFEMVMFYGSQGMRYYVDLDTILSPKKFEESDSFKKVKNII